MHCWHQHFLFLFFIFLENDHTKIQNSKPNKNSFWLKFLKFAKNHLKTLLHGLLFLLLLKIYIFLVIYQKVSYNDVLCITGSKVTALNVFYHSTFAPSLTRSHMPLGHKPLNALDRFMFYQVQDHTAKLLS